MTPLPRRSNVLPEAEAGVGGEQGLAGGVDRCEGEATPSQPRDSRPPRQGPHVVGAGGRRIVSPLELRFEGGLWITPEEAGKLGGIECMVELAVGDLAQAIKDLEALGERWARPEWLRRARRLRGQVEKLRAEIREELDA
jgi:hypothetical protein